MSRESITSARFSLRVDGEPHFLIVLSSEGHVKRMGYSTLSAREESVAAGRVEGLLHEVVDSMPPALLGRGGVYEDPGTDGPRCQWRIDFDSPGGSVRFDLTYCAGSAGLPPVMAQLVQKAEAVTEPLYREHLDSLDATSMNADVAPDAHPIATAAVARAPASNSEVGRSGSIGEYLSFRGRIGRVDYVLRYGLPLLALSFVGRLADGLVGFGGASGVGPMAVAASVLTFWPGMAGWAKRLHDFDTSLWVVPGVLGGGGVFAGIAMAVNRGLGVVALGLLGLGFIALTVATYFWPGTRGPNRYGPDPSAPGHF